MVAISQDGVAATQPNAQERCTCGWFVSWLWCVEVFFFFFSGYPAVFLNAAAAAAAQWCVHLSVFAASSPSALPAAACL